MSSLKKKKIARKKQMASFEWTDEDIEECSNSKVAGPQRSVKDLESIIARVQARKKEDEERAIRRALTQKVTPQNNAVLPGDSLLPHLSTANGVSDFLNSKFSELLESNQTLVTAVEAPFPLYLFDDSTYDEKMKVDRLPCNAVCLLQGDSPEVSPRQRGLGSWVPCFVMSVEDVKGNDVFVVQTNSDDGERNQLRVPRLHIIFETDRLELHIERVTAALERRRSCVALLKYHFIISKMPFDERIVSTLPEPTAQKILDRVINSKRLESSNESTIDSLLAETRTSFEIVMMEIIFRCNMLNKTNFRMFKDLALPHSVFFYTPIIPRSGLLQAPPHGMRTRISEYSRDGYLSCPAAILALQGVVSLNVRISQIKIYNLTYDKTLALDKFERHFQEMSMVAVRSIKQEWLQKAGAAVKHSLDGGEGVGDLTGGKYDIHMRNGNDYDSQFSHTKALLERSTMMMGTVLRGVLQDSLASYANFIEQLCDFTVHVDDIRTVSLSLPKHSIYRTQVLPPLLSVFLKITHPEKPVILNGDEVSAREQEISAWAKSKEAQEGGVYY